MSSLKSIAKSISSRPFFVVSSAFIMVAGMLFGANIATANSAWVQSYERTSHTEVCSARPGETPWQESWGTDPSWSPSWEQWANMGQGGWVCTRSITWAQTPVPEANSGAPEIATYTCLTSGVRSPGGGTCEVGDIGPGGGTVFYVDMARAVGSQFWEVGSYLGTAMWGCSTTSILGIGTEIGAGKVNTAAIMTGCVTPGIAARIASDTAGEYSDWFLPSKDELNQLCKYARMQSTAAADQAVRCNSTRTLRSGFASGSYWSSSQRVTEFVNFGWSQGFGDGFQGSSWKTLVLRVRPVRSF